MPISIQAGSDQFVRGCSLQFGTWIIAVACLLLCLSAPPPAQATAQPAGAASDSYDYSALVDGISKSKQLGLMTKLSIRKDANGFLKSMGAFHDGKSDLTLDQLHEQYDVMVTKLLVLVQDKDQALAADINDARDDLWATLSDAEKFAKL